VSDALVVRLAERTASALEALAAARELAAVNERDHLQPACVAEAKALRRSSTTQFRLVYTEWPRLGGVDLAFVEPGVPPILVELKGGSGNDALGPCVWDAAKLAFALQRGDATAAYLLAAAPLESWEKPIRGGEFFDTATWTVDGLRTSFADWWRTWEKRRDPQPTQLPATFETVALGRFAFVVAATTWELRLSRVLGGDAWMPWQPFLPTGDAP
jgi:hypothetical protein